MSDIRPVWRRRALLAGGAVGLFGWVKGAPYLLSLREPDLDFEDVEGLEPFRRLRGGGQTSSGNIVFAGLDPVKPPSADQERLRNIVRSDPCSAFYGPAVSGPVPVAVFSDFACPICRVMDVRLMEMEASDPDRFRIVRHQLPILGAASTTASRAVLAADRQGAYGEMHERLLRTPAVTDERFVTAIAGQIGLDTVRFLADMTSGEIDDELELTKAVAEVFGFFGTPAFAVGRTVFSGLTSKSTFHKLIAEEVGNPCQSI